MPAQEVVASMLAPDLEEILDLTFFIVWDHFLRLEQLVHGTASGIGKLPSFTLGIRDDILTVSCKTERKEKK